ncbi:MAG: cellulase family glycosylhydrolase [Anaerolineae bacterium]|nr:cellulase family glycosylhydrolase [Anaerolineae bacterium]
MQPLTIRDTHFVDAAGRQVLLHGIALVDKNPASGYLGHLAPGLFAAFRRWGFNCIRLGVIWDGLEPQPGVFSELYLQGLGQQVQWARENGLYVFLDMHQDLYSVLYSDGAPAWATLTGGLPHVNLSGVWSDAYFTSPAVQAALDAFWANTHAPDGTGLQDHLAAAWQVLAQRFAGNPAVIGYDLFNEPFPGSIAGEAQAAMFARGAEILASGAAGEGMMAAAPDGGDPSESLMQAWLTPQGRQGILELLRDVDLYAAVVDVQEGYYGPFEQTALHAFYCRAAQAIRSADPRGLLFLETTMAANMGVSSGIQPVVDAAGTRDLYQVYAPHGYDLVTDTPFVADACPERMRFIFERHARTARRLQMPMLVGEWGAYGDVPGTLAPAWQAVNLFEELLCGETFWAYFPGIEHTPSFPAVQRPYPQAVAGRLLSYHYHAAEDSFTCEWQEDGRVESPTRIYLPDWFHASAKQIDLHPAGSEFRFIPLDDGSGNVMVEIPVTGDAMRRIVRMIPAG